MNSVLLTGASGFVGQQALTLLKARGYFVHAVSSQSPGASDKHVQWHAANLLNSEEIDQLLASTKPTHLLHFAWYTEPGKYWTADVNLHWVRASVELFEAFASNGGQRAVMAGSCAEYDWSDGYCSEATTPLRPASLYGASKHALQTMVDAYSAQLGISTAWGRLFFLYGPDEYEQRLVPSTIRSLLSTRPARCTHGDQQRDFLYVTDVADAFVSLLDSNVTGPINIGSGEAVSVRNVVSLIGQKLQRGDLIELGAIPAPPQEPPIIVADATRLRNELGWKPKYSLDQGLDLTIAWWKQALDQK